jgi:hypothetical protein
VTSKSLIDAFLKVTGLGAALELMGTKSLVDTLLEMTSKSLVDIFLKVTGLGAFFFLTG